MILVFAVAAVLGNIVDKLFGTGYVARMGGQGLNLAQIGIVLTVASLVLAAANFPTGVLADRIGRKRTAALGFLVLGVGLGAYGYAATQPAFLVAITLWAIGMALISGAPTAWVVHELNRRGAGDARTTVLSRASSIGLVAGAAASMAATPLLAADPRSVFLVAAGLSLAAAALLPLLGPDNREDSARTVGLPTAIWASGRDLMADPSMRLALVKVGLRQIGFVVFLLSYQLAVTRLLHLPVSALGGILAVSILAVALGMWMVPVLAKQLRLSAVSLLGTAVCAAGLAVMALSTSPWPWLLGLVLFEWGLGADLASFGSLLHDFIPDDRRSGWLSALESVQTLIGAVGTISAGLLIETFGYRRVWTVAALLVALTTVPVVLLGRRSRLPEAMDA